VVAIFEIIAFHVPNQSTHMLGAVGLPLFLLLSLMFSVRQMLSEPTGCLYASGPSAC
jgi:hypothetical protein